MERNGKIKYSRQFLKQLSQLPKQVIEKTQEKEEIFKINPFDFRLDTHKLHGKDREAWVFSITYSYRIKFLFIPEGRVLFLEIGTHKVYK